VVERGKNLRNIAIIVVLALAVWQLPGGGTAANTIGNLLSLILFAGLVFFGYRLYMEHRATLSDLPDQQRNILYASAGLLVFALVATSRMWDSGGALILLWFALIGAAAYGFYSVFRAYREY
jgi:hypothetical protein